MFKKDNKVENRGKEDNNGSSINLVGDSTHISGEVYTETDIRVDGTIEGDIITKGKLVLGENALITGNSYCQSGDISGKIEGDIYSKDLLNLKSTAQVNGDIYTKRLIIEKDASFNGKCEMRDQVTFPQGKTINKESGSKQGIQQGEARSGQPEGKGKEKPGAEEKTTTA